VRLHSYGSGSSGQCAEKQEQDCLKAVAHRKFLYIEARLGPSMGGQTPQSQHTWNDYASPACRMAAAGRLSRESFRVISCQRKEPPRQRNTGVVATGAVPLTSP
jgi:hypothetical protein